jgi:hypothetical protein
MGEPVSLSFIFQTIGVILVITAICVVLVNQKTKNKVFRKNIKKEM